MEIKIAEESGFCFGVKRALELIDKYLARGIEFDTLGPLIHNRFVVEELKKKGIKPIDNLEQTTKKYVMIRTHGVPREVYEKARKLGITLIDATCPFVRKAQEAARRLSEEGYLVIVVGMKNHPEVLGILGNIEKGEAYVVGDPSEMDKLNLKGKKVGFVSQTTSRFDLLASCVTKALKVAEEIKIINTRCRTTERRQEAALKLAKNVDIMLVVGGRNSSNTKRLFELVSTVCPRSFHIESPEELRKEWFKGVERVGVAAGASTPYWLVEKTVETIKNFTKGGCR